MSTQACPARSSRHVFGHEALVYQSCLSSPTTNGGGEVETMLCRMRAPVSLRGMRCPPRCLCYAASVGCV